MSFTIEEMWGHDIELGEMNRLLLEKIEEQLLYILQLEERINELEKSKIKTKKQQ